MNHPRRFRIRTLTSIMLLCPLCIGGSIAHAAQPGGDERRDDQARRERPDTDRAIESPQELAARLRDRLMDLDALRARLASAADRLEAGESPEDVFDPEDRRLFMRSLRGRGDDGWFALPDRPRMDRPGMVPPDERAGDGRPSDGRPGVGRSEGGPKDQPPPLTDEQLAEVRAIIDAHIPMLASRLKAAEESDPEAADRFLVRIAPRFRDILELKEHAPELVEVRIDELRTGMAIVSASRDLRRLHADEPESQAFAEKKAEIRELLTRQFDLRQRLERHRIERQLEELNGVLDRLAEQAGDRDRVIDEHLERVVARTLTPGRDDGGRRRWRRDEGRDSDGRKDDRD